ncbi:MAG: sugar phosphate isomerase/epimerase [Verrucomicrobiae bacterium]|nr:sugar phosphate isomerase/epimerase [Verrucomicrobiae bacterium]
MNTSRRDFLKTGSAALAAGLASKSSLWSAAHAHGFSAKRPIGYSLYGMASLPVLDAIDARARIGYDNFEVCVMDGFPTQLDKFTRDTQIAVRDRARKHGLDISSILFHGTIVKENEQKKVCENIKKAGEISHVLNEKNPPLLESVMGGSKPLWDTGKQMIVDRIGAWAEAAASIGVKVAVKAHAGSAVHRSDQLLWVYRQVNHPNLALTYDYSHYKAEGFEMEPTMRDVVPHASFIHVKDVALWPPVRFLYAGEGTIDWVRYFELIRELKYTGPICVEVSGHIHKLSKYEPIQPAELCYQALSRARDKAYSV